MSAHLREVMKVHLLLLQSSLCPSSQSTSPQFNHPPSSSHKHPGSNALDQTTERMSQMAESLMVYLDGKCKGHVKHECYKHMKLESKVWAHDLKAHSAHDEREHAMHLTEQDHLHQQRRIVQKMDNTNGPFSKKSANFPSLGTKEDEELLLDTELKHKFSSLGTKEDEELLLDKEKCKFPSFGAKEDEGLLLDKESSKETQDQN
ncbi:hypothetical protein F4604DRAFT_1926666 [Suillus subluteus]|nr:hypothetical protein F4604DRAFT_1926666 [Suillus subluteus]